MAGSVKISPINSRSDALTGGTVASTMDYTPLPENMLGFQRGAAAPLVGMLGKEGPQKTTNIARYWLWRNDVPLTDTTSDDQDSSSTVLKVTTPALYQIGAQIHVGTEAMEVTGRGTDGITVTRGVQGTTPASHSSGVTVYIGSPAFAENTDTTNSPYVQGEQDYNVYQQIEYAWAISHRAETVATRENPNGGMFNSRAQDVLTREVPRRLEMDLLKNRRTAGDGVTASVFGGFDQPAFITTRTPISGPLSESDINTALQTVTTLQGSHAPKIAVGSPYVGRILSSFYAGSRWLAGDATSVTNYLDTIVTPFGPIKFVSDLNMASWAPDKLYLFDPNDIKQSPYDSNSNWQMGEYETQGWHRRQYVRADITYTFPFADSRIELYGFDTTDASYPGLV